MLLRSFIVVRFVDNNAAKHGEIIRRWNSITFDGAGWLIVVVLVNPWKYNAKPYAILPDVTLSECVENDSQLSHHFSSASAKLIRWSHFSCQLMWVSCGANLNWISSKSKARFQNSHFHLCVLQMHVPDEGLEYVLMWVFQFSRVVFCPAPFAPLIQTLCEVLNLKAEIWQWALNTFQSSDGGNALKLVCQPPIKSKEEELLQSKLARVWCIGLLRLMCFLLLKTIACCSCTTYFQQYKCEEQQSVSSPWMSQLWRRGISRWPVLFQSFNSCTFLTCTIKPL